MRLIPTSITQKTIDPNDPTGGMTLDALMQRQKQLVQSRPEVPAQIASPWQGAALMANTFVNSLGQVRAQQQEKAGRDLMAQTIAGIDPVKGATPEQQATMMRLDPDTSMKYIADAMQARRQQIQQDHQDALTREGWSHEDAAALAARTASEALTREGWQHQDVSQAATQAHEDVMKREGWSHEDIQAQKKLEAEQAAAGIFKPSDIGALRDDYTKAATLYDTAAPSWQSMKEAAKTSLGKTADEQGKGAADYNMIVGFAKLLDPNSVVREGEVTSASNLGGYIDTVKGWLNQWKANGGKLDNNVRLAIMDQANSRMKSYYDQVRSKHDWITGVASRHNVLPQDVVAPLGEFGAWEKPVEYMTDAELKAAAGQ
jgi:hypothetical protein